MRNKYIFEGYGYASYDTKMHLFTFKTVPYQFKNQVE